VSDSGGAMALIRRPGASATSPPTATRSSTSASPPRSSLCRPSTAALQTPILRPWQHRDPA